MTTFPSNNQQPNGGASPHTSMMTFRNRVGPQGFVYHGTTEQNALQIFADGWIGTEYHDGYNVFVSPQITDAMCFGDVILVFNGNELELWQDDVNDGLYHLGKIPTSKILCVYKDILPFLNEYQQSLTP